MAFGGYFDSVFCINLDRRPDRWAEAQAELALCRIENCERFQATAAISGVVGCTASHRRLWRHITAGGVGDRVLIFEDDFKFLTESDLSKAGYGPWQAEMKIFASCPGASLAERFSVMLSLVPEKWDLLYLGGSYETRPKERINKHVIRNLGMHCTHAYAISRDFAAKMTAELDAAYGQSVEVAAAPDSVLAQRSKSPDVVSYTLMPRLFIQRPGQTSDLNPGAPPGFPFSMTDSAHEMMVS